MTGTGEQEPIEIELTSHDPAGVGGVASRRDHDFAESVADSVVEQPLDDVLPIRRFGIAAVAIAAVAALVIGVAIGRLGGGDSVASTESTTESTVEQTIVATTADPLLQALDTVPPVPAPTTTRVSRSTAPPVESRTFDERAIEIHPALAGLPVELVVTTWDGTVRVVDVSAGTSRQVIFDTRFDGPAGVLAGQGWWATAGWNWDAGVSFTRDDGTVHRVDNVGPPVVRSADASGVWVSTTPFGAGAGEAIEIDGFGVPTGQRVDLDGGLMIGTDPLGGVVVRGIGGDYTVTPSGAALLTRGEVIGIGATTLLTEECDELRECNLRVIDRSSGDTNPIEVPFDVMSSPHQFYGPFAAAVTELSPGEAKAIVLSQADAGFPDEWVPPTASVIDLRSGDVQPIGDVDGLSLMRWSPDGRFVFWLSGAVIEAFDVETGVSVSVDASLTNVARFDVRPTLPSVDPGSVVLPAGPSASTAPTEP